MEITNEAKQIIMSVLNESEFGALNMYTEGNGCSKSLGFDLIEKSDDITFETINDIAILMDEETREWTTELIIDAKDGNLVLINPNGGCGCHSHDGGCGSDEGCGSGCGCH